MTKLTAKETLFVEAYLIELQASKAAVAAGYSKKSAREAGYRVLKRPHIEAAVLKAFREREKRTHITQDWVVSELVDNYERAMAAKPVCDTHGKETGVFHYRGALAIKILDMLGRHVGMWRDNDGQRPQPDFVPLEDRLKVLNRERTIDEAENIEWLPSKGNGAATGNGAA